jgi:hypothetical protein
LRVNLRYGTYIIDADDNSLLEESMITTTATTDEMPESYIVSRDESESFVEYSSGDELRESKYHVESIILDEDEEQGENSSPLAEI